MITYEQKVDLARAAYNAQIIADALNVAYWTTDNQSVFEMKIDDAHRRLAGLANLLGYKVVKE